MPLLFLTFTLRLSRRIYTKHPSTTFLGQHLFSKKSALLYLLSSFVASHLSLSLNSKYNPTCFIIGMHSLTHSSIQLVDGKTNQASLRSLVLAKLYHDTSYPHRLFGTKKHCNSFIVSNSNFIPILSHLGSPSQFHELHPT